MVQLTINGKQIEAAEGTTVLQAARQNGIEIPTLCDHPAVKPFGGCRLCIVEIQGWRAPVASCTLPVSNGLVIETETEKLKASRKFILDMLFSERNHFCPFCQVSGGDCELQNAAYGEGMTTWDFPPLWKKFEVDASHADLVLDHNRCILCRRCIRACSDLVGNFTLTASERGSATLITADYGLPLGQSSCVSCGMCAQVCPTGAIIDRASAYKGHRKNWEATQSTCVGCSVGCTVTLWTRDNQLTRIEGDWDAALNQGLVCEKGRFEPMKETRKRITTPMIRKDGKLQSATWEEAISVVASNLSALKGLNGHGVAALASTRLPAEALFAFKQLFADGLGSGMVTSIEEGLPTSGASKLAEALGCPFESRLDALKDTDMALAIGVDMVKSHQVAGFLVKRLLPAEVPLAVIDPGENLMKTIAHVVIEPEAGQDAVAIEAVRQYIKNLAAGCAAEASNNIEYLGEALYAAKRPVIVYGKGVAAQSDLKTLRSLFGLVEDLRALGKDAAVLGVKGEANSLAAAQYGLDQVFAINGQQAVFLALGDDFPTQRLVKRIEQTPFKVVSAAYASAATEMADVVLPAAAWSEQNGHYLNLDGRLQTAKAVVSAPSGVPTTSETLAQLAASLNLAVSDEWKPALLKRVSPVALDLN
jgi:formate dehydrogenase major subunit